jgi:hypothetical protein
MSKLVRVSGDKLVPRYADEGAAMLEEHGYLWFLEEDTDDEGEGYYYDFHRYRSLATGEEYWWYDSEVEEHNDG